MVRNTLLHSSGISSIMFFISKNHNCRWCCRSSAAAAFETAVLTCWRIARFLLSHRLRYFLRDFTHIYCMREESASHPSPALLTGTSQVEINLKTNNRRRTNDHNRLLRPLFTVIYSSQKDYAERNTFIYIYLYLNVGNKRSTSFFLPEIS